MKKTDWDVCKLKEKMKELAEAGVGHFHLLSDDSYYQDVSDGNQAGIIEYGFENTVEFMTALKAFWESSDKKEMYPLVPYCVASVFRYYQDEYEEIDREGTIADFIYEF